MNFRDRISTLMMGRSHALSGAAAWLGAAAWYSAATHTTTLIDPPVLILGTAIAAGAALLPDFDNYSSTAVNSLGFVGRGIYYLVNMISLAVYNLIRGRRDEFKENGHRTLFHTFPMAIVAGGLAALASASGGEAFKLGHTQISWGQFFALLIMTLCMDLALGGIFQKQALKYKHKFGPFVFLAASFIITLIVAFMLPSAVGHTYAWLGIAVGFGWVVHLLGDFITKNGIPAWPLPIRGKLWYDAALPSVMRIEAGGTFEQFVLVPIFSVAALGLFIYDILIYTGVLH